MRRAVLLGNPDTKRTVYFQKAAIQEGLSFSLLEWGKQTSCFPDGDLFLKIDPPVWTSCSLGELECLTAAYREELNRLDELTKKRVVEFFNTPSVITELLDKYECKMRLKKAGLSVTELLTGDSGCGIDPSGLSIPEESCRVRRTGDIRNAEQLLAEMERKRWRRVFIKPVCGSGAAGVSAFCLQPGTGRMSLYTCASKEEKSELVNTKKLRHLMEPGEIRMFLDGILRMDCVIERWYAKAMRGEYVYDLRVVMQEGRMDYLLARLSKGPITNLQLNNHPCSMEELELPLKVVEEVEELCQRAMDCFPGLGCAGIDILLEKGSLKPRIIEMNAQGDLIYQDIYHDNIIYRRQAQRMKTWLCV